MRKNLAQHYGIEGGNFTTPSPELQTEENLTPEANRENKEAEIQQVADNAEVTTDNTGAIDASKTPESVIEDSSDNSSTVVIDQQEETNKPDLVAKKQLVFLGGTCSESVWRDKLIDGLKMSYFNPVVQDWKEDDKEKENQIKDSADFNLFVFTPKHTGYFSFVEAALSAVKSPSRTILCVLQDDDGVSFEEDKKRSIDAIVDALDKEGIKVFNSLDDVRAYLNNQEDPNGEQTAPVSEETSQAMAEPASNNDNVVKGGPIKQQDLIEAGNTDSAELETNDASVSVKVETPTQEKEGESTNE